jgi:hypothetical protein
MPICINGITIKKPVMKKNLKNFGLISGLIISLFSCSKSNTTTTASSPIAGFWTYKEDANNDYWNGNVLFNNDGTFRMYTALSLIDTSAVQAIKDTANQVVTFGTYTVKGNSVKMVWQEFSAINFNFSGILNTTMNNLTGNVETSESNSASPLWILTKP